VGAAVGLFVICPRRWGGVTVKAGVGRRRYLLLRFAPPVSRHRLARLLETRLSPLGGAVRWRLLRCDDGEAVVRVDHRVARARGRRSTGRWARGSWARRW